MKKIQSGEGASDFGTVEKKAENETEAPLADWERELLDQAEPIFGKVMASDLASSLASLRVAEPTVVAPLTEKWVTDVIYNNWVDSHDSHGFPHWIANAAQIIVAGR